MGLDLEMLSTRRAVITPAEFADAWERTYGVPAPDFRRLDGGEKQSDDIPFILDAYYGLYFPEDGNGPGFDVSRNRPGEFDERTYLEDFGDASHLTDAIDAWRRVGHTYGLTLNGAYGAADVRRMEQVAEVIAGLVGELIIALTPLPFGRGRGVYRAEGTRVDMPSTP